MLQGIDAGLGKCVSDCCVMQDLRVFSLTSNATELDFTLFDDSLLHFDSAQHCFKFAALTAGLIAKLP